MRRVFCLFSFLLLVSVFCVSCGDDEEPAEPTEQADTESVDTDTNEPADTGDTDTAQTAECGNKIIEEGEICDGGAQECSAINPAYTGYAYCKTDCSGWDESNCQGGDTPVEPTDPTDPTEPTNPTEPTDTTDPVEEEIEIGEPLGEVTVSNKPNGVDGIFFDGPGEDELLIYYPGASIDPSAYSSIMTLLAERGVDCIIIKMLANMAILGQNKADDVYTNYTSYKKFYLSGHSMGGAMIANYAAKTSNQIDGLFMMAAYPTENLTAVEYPILFIYGSNDGVINRDKLATGLTLTPASAVNYEIPGGNHAYFGDYGEQNGDGTATISPITQQKITVREILKLIR